MTTVQIVGIAVAAAVVLLLIIALLMTRRRRSVKEKPTTTARGSFLDDAPQDTLSTLGKAEQPMEDITMDPGVQRQGPPAAGNAVPTPPVAASAQEPGGGALGLYWGPSGDTQGAVVAAAAVVATSPPAPADDETAGELPAAHTPAATPTTLSPVTESGDSADEPEPARPAEGGSATSQEAAPESGAGGHRVPLSDIIVTTSSKMVDLQDPEVRHMLTDLVRDEIDQATHYRQQGQNIDAVLQLTEAEKISRALAMRDSAAAIRKMIEDLQGQV